MYKFEICADSAKELDYKINEFAKNLLGKGTIPAIVGPAVLVASPAGDDDDMDTEDVDVANPLLAQAQQNAAGPTIAPFLQKGLSVDPNAPKGEPLYNNPAPVTSPIGQVDSRGLPWDERIHSANRATLKDGSWRYKKGTTDEFINQVEQELIAKIKNAPTEPVQLPPVPATTVHATLPNFAQQPVTPVQASPAPVAAQPVQLAPAFENIAIPQASTLPAYDLPSFKHNLLEILTRLINEKKIDQNYIQQLQQHFKVQHIWHITGSETQSRELWEQFGNYGFIKAVDHANQYQ